MLNSEFEKFRDVVLAEESLQAGLRGPMDPAEFAKRAVELGRELGFQFTTDDVDFARREGRRLWIEQGI